MENTENKETPKDTARVMRQIIIETDGNNINLVKADVAGSLELVAVLEGVINHVKKGSHK